VLSIKMFAVWISTSLAGSKQGVTLDQIEIPTFLDFYFLPICCKCTGHVRICLKVMDCFEIGRDIRSLLILI
jgi:hypothetical protein